MLALHKEKTKINWLLPIGLLIFLHIFNETLFTDALKYITVFSTFVCIAKSKIAVKLPKIPDISYGIFLFGWPLQQFICTIIPQANYFLSLGIALLLAFVFGYITYKFVEQPSSKLQNKILNFYYQKKKEV